MGHFSQGVLVPVNRKEEDGTTQRLPQIHCASPSSGTSKSSPWQRIGSAAPGFHSTGSWGVCEAPRAALLSSDSAPTRKARALLIGRDEVINPEFPPRWTAVQAAPTASEFI